MGGVEGEQADGVPNFILKAVGKFGGNINWRGAK